jgi:hypothetical protein
MVARVGREGTTSGRPEEWWRVPAWRSWSGGELGRRSWRRRRPRGTIGAAGPRGGARSIGVRKWQKGEDLWPCADSL